VLRLRQANAELAELRAKFKEAKKSKDDKAMGGLTTKIHAKEQAIQKMGILAKNREDLKTVALGTSKINYLDPRITVAWCKRNEVPIEKVFNRALFTKFLWAMDCSPDFRF
jgi:DNA topoisomerase-1